ncbi:hypothetical protein [Microbacterium marinilacus]|uniref:Uncharacterized protein n=1 Tax=Microbacterium marinilacus TaxID=415209 RepID=A0ABP7BLM1_9MICO|nr:hypothetical protein [Microbacterium marinilacus]MBY0688818.1 hypothetical protein [Microbacterium marinilacus]
MPLPTLLRRQTGSALVAIPLTLWGLATIVTQLGRGGKIIRSCDPTGLIVPDWRFFAPFPAEHEYHLLYRDELADGTTTPWQEVNFGQHRRLIHLVWAPHRRMEKGLFDATSELLRVTDSTDDMRIIRLSTSYLALLNVVTHHVDHPSQARRTQFLVIRAAEYEPSLIPDPMFMSELHRLENVR